MSLDLYSNHVDSASTNTTPASSLLTPNSLGNRYFQSTTSLSLSLSPDQRPADATKRKLLLVYIHGFMGSEASFNDFPAHVHGLVTIALSESHLVYSKIYPRYKSRGEISVARDAFSDWLSPYESDDLDVILLGHSLGGILAAEVALLPLPESTTTKHRILGLVNFDVPFLGIHPGVIPTGLRSLFPRKAGKPPECDPGLLLADGGVPSPFAVPIDDPHFDPPFQNDVRLVQRGRWHGFLRFVEKNVDDLRGGVQEYLSSYYKFTGCMADYADLRRRYRRLVELEEVDDYRDQDETRRVRFVNYYTASTGYRKGGDQLKEIRSDDQICRQREQLGVQSHDSSPSILVTPAGQSAAEDTPDGDENSSPTHSTVGRSEMPNSTTVDKGIPEGEKTVKIADNQSQPPPLPPRASVSDSQLPQESRTPPSKANERKFCSLPSTMVNRSGDPLWVRVHLEDVDEVVAHQSMFLAKGTYYDRLVGDTVARVEGWVQEDLTRRKIGDMNR